MNRVTAILDGASDADETVDLDFDDRKRRRAIFRTRGGREILLDLPHAPHLRGGQALLLDDGTRIGIEAKCERLAVIRCPDLPTLVRIAWHLGNRHLPTQILGATHPAELRIRTDHVIEAMVAGLGGTVTPIDAPFDPEGGAYSGTGGDRIHPRHHGHHAH